MRWRTSLIWRFLCRKIYARDSDTFCIHYHWVHILAHTSVWSSGRTEPRIGASRFWKTTLLHQPKKLVLEKMHIDHDSSSRDSSKPIMHVIMSNMAQGMRCGRGTKQGAMELRMRNAASRNGMQLRNGSPLSSGEQILPWFGAVRWAMQLRMRNAASCHGMRLRNAIVASFRKIFLKSAATPCSRLCLSDWKHMSVVVHKFRWNIKEGVQMYAQNRFVCLFLIKW